MPKERFKHTRARTGPWGWKEDQRAAKRNSGKRKKDEINQERIKEKRDASKKKREKIGN